MKFNYIIIRRGPGYITRIIKSEDTDSIVYENVNNDEEKPGILNVAKQIQERVDRELSKK